MNTVRVLLGVFTLFGMFVVFSNLAFASCAVNEDWPDAPCFDVLPVNREEYRTAWAPYHDYKGSEWMEEKKVELLLAIENGTFKEWENNIENYNVYQYYHSIGLVPNQYEYFFFEDEAPYRQYVEPNLGLIFVVVGIGSGLAASVAFISRRKRK